jgi:hypothetical protein
MHVVSSVLHHLLSASNLPKTFSSLSCKVPSISCAPHLTSSELMTVLSHPQKLPALECLSVVGADFGIQGTLYSSGCRPPGTQCARGPRPSQHVKIWYAAASHSCCLIVQLLCFASKLSARPESHSSKHCREHPRGHTSSLLGAQTSKLEVQSVHVLLGILPCRHTSNLEIGWLDV